MDKDQASSHRSEIDTNQEKKRGRMLGLSGSTAEKETEETGKVWNEIRLLTSDLAAWNRFVGILCSGRSKESR